MNQPTRDEYVEAQAFLADARNYAEGADEVLTVAERIVEAYESRPVADPVEVEYREARALLASRSYEDGADDLSAAAEQTVAAYEAGRREGASPASSATLARVEGQDEAGGVPPDRRG